MKKLAIMLMGALWVLPAVAEPSLRLDASITMRMSDPRFGGFSSLEVAADGMSFIATSDRGTLLRGDITRENGRMVGVANLRLTDILDSKGAPLTGYHVDAEGLAVSESGEIFISFEANHRVMVQTGPEATPEFVPKHPEFRTLINNSGLEALAIAPDGTVFAIPERSGDVNRPFPVYRFSHENWSKSWSIPRIGDFLVTGADIFAGHLYVLERDFKLGFASRVRRFEIGAEAGEVLLETRPGAFDNMEGIALWQPQGDAVRVILISDDNFLFLQRNQMVEFVLEE
ncbi:MAG: esterase-like activity of phytase family protein [Rhodobacteraceae bacterium]|nr:esterase-like activity of phytase family protein [Paracoccaceae bacterium]